MNWLPFLVVVVLLPGPVQASIAPHPSILETPLDSASVVAGGSLVLIAGGWSGRNVNATYVFDVGSGEIEAGDPLPVPMRNMPGDQGYPLFYAGFTDTYSPGNSFTWSKLSALGSWYKLDGEFLGNFPGAGSPPPRPAGALWLNEGIFVGGYLPGGPTNQILNEFQTRGAQGVRGHLPTPWVFGASAVVDGKLYLFGGWDGTRNLDAIVEVAPDFTARTMPGRLPWPRSNLTAATDGKTVYLFGGEGSDGPTDEILRFTPQGGIKRQCDRLLMPLASSAAARLGDGRIVIIGGHGRQGLVRLIQVYEDTPCPTPRPMNADFAAATCGLQVELAAQNDGEAPFQWSWDLGDGASATGRIAKHTYPSAGTYDVRLRVVGNDARSAEARHAVRVAGTCQSAPTWPDGTPSPEYPTAPPPTLPPGTTDGPPATTTPEATPACPNCTPNQSPATTTARLPPDPGDQSPGSSGPTGSSRRAQGTPATSMALAIFVVAVATGARRRFS